MADPPLPAGPCLRGDEAELFRLHIRRLVRFVQYDAGVPEQVAEDCASLAFLQLCRRQPERERTLGWLRVVARHEAYAWHRHMLRFPSLEQGAPRRTRIDDGEPFDVTERIAAPVDVELAVEAREALLALAKLRPNRRAALTLRVSGLRYREIQRRLGVTYTWVNRHVSEGRAELRRGLAPTEIRAGTRARPCPARGGSRSGSSRLGGRCDAPRSE